MPGRWLKALEEEENKHNTAAALREEVPSERIGGDKKAQTPINPPSKTSNTSRANSPTSINGPAKTSKTPDADLLGLVATWSAEFGYVSIHDPLEGVWWDVATRDAPPWAVSEAHKRKELYKDGNRRAYRLTSRQMEEIWEADHPEDPDLIVEDHPVEES